MHTQIHSSDMLKSSSFFYIITWFSSPRQHHNVLVHTTKVSIPSRFAAGLVSKLFTEGGSGGGGGPDTVPASYLSQYSLTNF